MGSLSPKGEIGASELIRSLCATTRTSRLRLNSFFLGFLKVKACFHSCRIDICSRILVLLVVQDKCGQARAPDRAEGVEVSCLEFRVRFRRAGRLAA